MFKKKISSIFMVMLLTVSFSPVLSAATSNESFQNNQNQVVDKQSDFYKFYKENGFSDFYINNILNELISKGTLDSINGSKPIYAVTVDENTNMYLYKDGSAKVAHWVPGSCNSSHVCTNGIVRGDNGFMTAEYRMDYTLKSGSHNDSIQKIYSKKFTYGGNVYAHSVHTTEFDIPVQYETEYWLANSRFQYEYQFTLPCDDCAWTVQAYDDLSASVGNDKVTAEYYSDQINYINPKDVEDTKRNE